ncbi:unnamed protein product [Caenorhabditis nigoni]
MSSHKAASPDPSSPSSPLVTVSPRSDRNAPDSLSGDVADLKKNDDSPLEPIRPASPPPKSTGNLPSSSPVKTAKVVISSDEDSDDEEPSRKQRAVLSDSGALDTEVTAKKMRITLDSEYADQEGDKQRKREDLFGDDGDDDDFDRPKKQKKKAETKRTTGRGKGIRMQVAINEKLIREKYCDELMAEQFLKQAEKDEMERSINEQENKQVKRKRSSRVKKEKETPRPYTSESNPSTSGTSSATGRQQNSALVQQQALMNTIYKMRPAQHKNLFLVQDVLRRHETSGAREESVHFLMLPKPDESLIDESVERREEVMRNVIDLVRLVKDREGIAVMYPLKEMIVINRDSQFLEDVKSLEPYILLQLNVRQLTVSQDKHKYGITLKAEPNFKILGARLKGEQKKVADYLKNKVTEAELEQFLLEGKLTVLGHEITSEEVAVSYAAGADQGHGYKTHSDAKTIVMIDTTEDESLVEEGLCREVTNRVQRLRKQANLVSTDTAHVHLVVHPAGSQLATVVAAKLKDIESATGTPIKLGAPPADAKPATAVVEIAPTGRRKKSYPRRYIPREDYEDDDDDE